MATGRLGGQAMTAACRWACKPAAAVACCRWRQAAGKRWRGCCRWWWWQARTASSGAARDVFLRLSQLSSRGRVGARSRFRLSAGSSVGGGRPTEIIAVTSVGLLPADGS
jgi:hypothetical protein